jgi:transposase
VDPRSDAEYSDANAGWLSLRYQPNSALARWFTGRVGEIRARNRKITALARKQLVALWRYVTTGLMPEGARLKPIAT